MWIANRKRLEFTNIDTGFQISIWNDEIRACYYFRRDSYIVLAKVNGYDDAMKKYAEILEILKERKLLLVEYEE